MYGLLGYFAVSSISVICGFLISALMQTNKVNDLYEKIHDLEQKVASREKIVHDLSVSMRNLVLIFTDENYTSEQRLDVIMKTESFLKGNDSYFRG